ncbi:unnamed protein product [Microthlaspi erraticum]|uniref:Uncharacterized protein n=1 Tax=Microthlaspi erraticum TaxID=1685480 RepID=A0A6D2KZV2_9BRAS|nr:unnamed protein product [Microthlaspi erraticum]
MSGIYNDLSLTLFVIRVGWCGTSSRSIGSVEDVGGGDAPVFLFRLLLLNVGSTVLVGDAADRGIRSSPFLSLILQVHRSEVVNGYRTQGPDYTLQVMSLRTS